MSKLINVDFQSAKKYPEDLSSDWIFSKCKSESNRKHYVSFKVYKTDSKFAVQFCDGLSHQHKMKPDEILKSRPHYFKNLENLWKYISHNLEDKKVNEKAVKRVLMKNRIKENFVCIE